MAGGFGTADVSKNYPVPSNSGLGEDDYHKGRKVRLEAEEKGLISSDMLDIIE